VPENFDHQIFDRPIWRSISFYCPKLTIKCFKQQLNFFGNHWINDGSQTIVNQMIEIFQRTPKNILGK